MSIEIKTSCPHNIAEVKAELMKTVDAETNDVLGHSLHITTKCKECGNTAVFLPSQQPVLIVPLTFNQAVAFVGGRPENN